MNILLLVAALLIILAGAEAFTNALEHLGDRLGISEGVTGSIFAAVGTALPETMVPVVAVFAATSGQPAHLGEEVGVGAILGAPMMLSTLTLFMMALFVSPQRGWHGALNPEPTGLRRDLGWFLIAFGLSTIALFVPHHITLARIGIALMLVTLYFLGSSSFQVG
ncbi:sodium:calcium antiporter, partial [Acidithiobacillus ferridurans]|nr:sodium:calcium antiporter [Acidithiobacillus ferridurans]